MWTAAFFEHLCFDKKMNIFQAIVISLSDTILHEQAAAKLKNKFAD